MNGARTGVDLDDTDGLADADRDGLLRAAAMAGAQVRATVAAIDEGALAPLSGVARPRTMVWVGGRGSAEAAGAMLSAALSGTAGEPLVLAADSPPWIGPLDVLIVAGDDPADPVLVNAAATAVRRGASVVVAAPYAGPLRDATAGRAAVLEPRVWVPDDFGLCRYLAAGLATLAAVDPAVPADLATLADRLDNEALRNGIGREVFTNPAKALAGRMSGRSVVLAGDCAATRALARHGSAVLLRVAGQSVAAVGLADVVIALRGKGMGGNGLGGNGMGVGGLATQASDSVDALFHDEDIDGPLPGRSRVIALSLTAERPILAARVAGLDDIDLLGAEDTGTEDVGEGGTGPVTGPAAGGRVEQQLAVLALRLEMAAVYLRLAAG